MSMESFFTRKIGSLAKTILGRQRDAAMKERSSNYKLWFPPDGQKISMAMLYEFQKSAKQVGHNAFDWSHKHQVYVNGDQLEDLVKEASEVLLAPLTFFHDYLLAFDRSLKPRNGLVIELDKITTINSIQKYVRNPVMMTEPRWGTSEGPFLRSWRIRVYCHSPESLWLGFSYNSEEIRAVAEQTPIVVKSEAELQAWLHKHGVCER